MTNKVKKIQKEEVELHEAAEKAYPIVARLEGANHYIDRQTKQLVNYVDEIHDLKEKILQLEHDLKEQKFCYLLASSRTKKYKSQINIIKEALNMEVIC